MGSDPLKIEAFRRFLELWMPAAEQAGKASPDPTGLPAKPDTIWSPSVSFEKLEQLSIQLNNSPELLRLLFRNLSASSLIELIDRERTQMAHAPNRVPSAIPEENGPADTSPDFLKSLLELIKTFQKRAPHLIGRNILSEAADEFNGITPFFESHPEKAKQWVETLRHIFSPIVSASKSDPRPIDWAKLLPLRPMLLLAQLEQILEAAHGADLELRPMTDHQPTEPQLRTLVAEKTIEFISAILFRGLPSVATRDPVQFASMIHRILQDAAVTAGSEHSFKPIMDEAIAELTRMAMHIQTTAAVIQNGRLQLPHFEPPLSFSLNPNALLINLESLIQKLLQPNRKRSRRSSFTKNELFWALFFGLFDSNVCK